MHTITDEELRQIMPTGTGKNVASAEQTSEIKVQTTRKVIVVGCGDGGCNIANEIAGKIADDTYVICYNTSPRNMRGTKSEIKVLPTGTDGAGKVRQFSKNIFKSEVHTHLLENVRLGITQLGGEVSYIIICTTADGGTGSGISPMAAKLLLDNTNIPVIVIGVYPSMAEDAIAQYNTIEWQEEMEKVITMQKAKREQNPGEDVPQLCYFLLDNNSTVDADSSKMSAKDSMLLVHAEVNRYAARIASLISGNEFGNTKISIIDNRNLYMLLSHLGERSVLAISNARPTAGQTLDDYIEMIMTKDFQMAPTSPMGIGVFVKGPRDLLDRMDASVPGIQEKYGNAVLRFAHIEESETVEIAILFTGCTEPSQRLLAARARYDDVMSSQKERSSVTSSVKDGLLNPMGTYAPAVKSSVSSSDPDLSALDL